jgi:outer membrane lipoprotein-sorting protein
MFPPSRKTGRTLDAVVASWIERLPFVAGLPALADVWPQQLSDYTYARLPDETLEKVKCQVIESRPKRPDGGFDRIVTLLTPDSHVALETRWLRGDKVVRLDRVADTDIDTSQGRPVVVRHEIVQGSDAAQIVYVGRFSLDPVLPDQLFTTSNLRIGRFPSY